MTIYEGDTGKRSKLVRKLTKPPCKADELTAYWAGNTGVGDKCKAHMAKTFDSPGRRDRGCWSKSLVVTLRGTGWVSSGSSIRSRSPRRARSSCRGARPMRW